MKSLFKSLLAVAALVAVHLASAKEVEPISVVEGDTITINVPFAVKSYSPSNKEVCRVDDLGGSELRVTALKRGRCDLNVAGDNGLQQKYEISVVGDLASILETLTLDLDSVPEVKAEIRGDFIRLDGEVGSIAKWEYLTKVLANYGKGVRNFVKFDPGPESLERLKATFGQAGLKVQFKPFEGLQAKWPYNTVALDLNKKTKILSVQANCLQAEQRQTIISILTSEPWLIVSDGKSEGSKSSYGVKTFLTLPIASPMIRLSVAYLAIGEEDVSQVGSPNTLEISGKLNYFVNLARGNTEGSSAIIGAGLEPTVSFLANNGVSRVSNKAYTMLNSWDPKGASFKSGGTIFVRVSGQTSGDLKEVPYGFDVKVKGGLLSEDKVSLDLDISKSAILSSNGDIDKKEDKTQQRLTCPLGKTLVLGGFGEMVDSASLNGVPMIRHTPILKWFVSQDGKNLSTRRLLILVSPEIVDNARDGGLNVDNEITIPTETDSKKDIEDFEKEKDKYTGFWSWLNWFRW